MARYCTEWSQKATCAKPFDVGKKGSRIYTFFIIKHPIDLSSKEPIYYYEYATMNQKGIKSYEDCPFNKKEKWINTDIEKEHDGVK